MISDVKQKTHILVGLCVHLNILGDKKHLLRTKTFILTKEMKILDEKIKKC